MKTFKIYEIWSNVTKHPGDPSTIFALHCLTSASGFSFPLRFSDPGDVSEDDEDDLDEVLVTHSPEPPEPVEPDDAMQTDENGQPGTLHPELDLPHIFKVGLLQLVCNAKSILFFAEVVVLVSGL